MSKRYYVPGFPNPALARLGHYLESAPHSYRQFYETPGQAAQYINDTLNNPQTMKNMKWYCGTDRDIKIAVPTITTIYTMDVPDKQAEEMERYRNGEDFATNFINPHHVSRVNTRIHSDLLHDTLEIDEIVVGKPSHEGVTRNINDRIAALSEVAQLIERSPNRNGFSLNDSRTVQSFRLLYAADGFMHSNREDLETKFMQKVAQQMKETMDAKALAAFSDFYSIYTARLESMDSNMNPETRVSSAMSAAINTFAAQLPRVQSNILKEIGSETNLRGLINEIEREGAAIDDIVHEAPDLASEYKPAAPETLRDADGDGTPDEYDTEFDSSYEQDEESYDVDD